MLNLVKKLKINTYRITMQKLKINRTLTKIKKCLKTDRII